MEYTTSTSSRPSNTHAHGRHGIRDHQTPTTTSQPAPSRLRPQSLDLTSLRSSTLIEDRRSLDRAKEQDARALRYLAACSGSSELPPTQQPRVQAQQGQPSSTDSAQREGQESWNQWALVHMGSGKTGALTLTNNPLIKAGRAWHVDALWILREAVESSGMMAEVVKLGFLGASGALAWYVTAKNPTLSGIFWAPLPIFLGILGFCLLLASVAFSLCRVAGMDASWLGEEDPA